jgi:hypothetical protein
MIIRNNDSIIKDLNVLFNKNGEFVFLLKFRKFGLILNICLNDLNYILIVTSQIINLIKRSLFI